MATQVNHGLPYGVGRWSAGSLITAGFAVVLLGLGVFAYSRQLIEGKVVTGLRDIGTGAGSAWGLDIAFLVYFVGVSFAGISTAALIRVMNLEHLKPISRMAEVLTVVALITAAITVLLDLGQPARGIVNLFKYARPQSPFFGTFSLVVSGYLFASLVYLYLDGRRDAAICARRPGRLQWFHRLWAAGYKDTPEERERHARTSWRLALAILPLLVVAHSTLGFVFGIQVGRPGWFSAAQAPGFVIMAGVSGIGLLIVLAAIFRKALHLEGQIGPGIFRWLGNFLWVLTIAYLYLLVAETLTANYASTVAEATVASAMLNGPYASVFWTSVALLSFSFLVLFVQFVAKRHSIGLTVLAGILVNLAAVGKRFLVVVPSQTHGTLLPYLPGSYSPTWVEYSMILGLIGLGILLYLAFMKVFPIAEIKEVS